MSSFSFSPRSDDRGGVLDDLFFAFFGRRLLFPFPFRHQILLGRRKPLDELAGGRHFCEQLLDVLLATTRGLHHRDPSQRVGADVEDQAVPVGGDHGVGPA